ncbi:MAG: hypothetical protein NTY38_12705, partial [Acidobacteria bacterium]|nr:hypothetical protein [Acidobacteriota bacterium]
DCQPAETPASSSEAVRAFRQAVGGAAGWEVISLQAVERCGRYLLAAPAAGDQLRAYSVEGRGTQPASEMLELGGTLTALWPAPGGALAIVYEEKTDRYAAYSLALTCSR